MAETSALRQGVALTIMEACDAFGLFLKRMADTNYVAEIGSRLSSPAIPKGLGLIYAPAYPDIVEKDFRNELVIADMPSKTAANPEAESFGHIITYKVIKHVPASLENTEGGGRKQEKPWIHEDMDLDTHKEVIKTNDGFDVATIESRWWDNTVQFDCFGKTNAEAMKLCQNFENMLMIYGGAMSAFGVQKGPLHRGWTEDSELKNRLNKLRVQSVLFYMRTEQFFISLGKAMDEFNMILQVQQ